MQVNLYRDVKAAYMRGASQQETMAKYGIKQYEYSKIINKIVKDCYFDLKTDRIEQAKLMEINILKMAKEGKDISGLINQFSSFCA